MIKQFIFQWLFLTIAYVAFSQKNFESEYFKLISPSDFSVTRNIAKDGFIDILTVQESDSSDAPRYLIYLHKSVIPDSVELSSVFNNPTLYTSDFNCSVKSVKETVYNGYDGVSLVVHFNGYENVVGYVFISVIESTLNRIIFMSQDVDFQDKYMTDIEMTLSTLIIKEL